MIFSPKIGDNARLLRSCSGGLATWAKSNIFSPFLVSFGHGYRRRSNRRIVPYTPSFENGEFFICDDSCISHRFRKELIPLLDITARYQSLVILVKLVKKHQQPRHGAFEWQNKSGQAQ